MILSVTAVLLTVEQYIAVLILPVMLMGKSVMKQLMVTYL